MLTAPIPLVLTDDPVAKYAEIAASLAPGQKYVQEFDYLTKENPLATEIKNLEDIYPNATVLGPDGDVGSWEISQQSLGACGTFSNIAGYASSQGEYRLENGIYPLEPSPIGLYFVRIQDPANPLGITWMAIDSKVPCKPGGKSNFIGVSTALAPALAMKAAATARGGCFDEITNSASLKQTFNWFPSVSLKYSTFESLAAAIGRGAICVFSMADQYDGAGNKITPSGVVYGHAFALVDTLQTTGADGEVIQLVRIENPWGSGSDYVCDYSDNAPFWDAHPELAQKRSDAQQTGGNYWVSWNQLKQLAGRTEFAAQIPLPIAEYPEMAAVYVPFNGPPPEVNMLTVHEPTNFLIATRWLSGSGDRHQQIKFLGPDNAVAAQTPRNYWGTAATHKVTLQAGVYRLVPNTSSLALDRGELQILILADKPF